MIVFFLEICNKIRIRVRKKKLNIFHYLRGIYDYKMATTIILLDGEIVVDNSILQGIPYFNAILNKGFKEPLQKKIKLEFLYSNFLKLLKNTISSKNIFVPDNKYFELCDYLHVDSRTCEYTDNDFDYYRGVIDKNTYIIKMILEFHDTMYFSNLEHFSNFYNNPIKKGFLKSKTCQTDCNVLSFLIFKNFDLMRYAIKEEIFDKININQKLTFNFKKGSTIVLTLLEASCRYSLNYSSYDIVRSLLYHPNIKITDNILSDVLFNLNVLSSRSVSIILIEYKNGFLINKGPITPLMYIIWKMEKNSNYKEAFRLLVNNPILNIKIKLACPDEQSYIDTPRTAIEFALKYGDFETIKTLLDLEGTKEHLKYLNNTNHNAFYYYFNISLKSKDKELIKLLLDYLQGIGIEPFLFDVTRNDIIFNNFIDHPIINFDLWNRGGLLFWCLLWRYNITPIMDQKDYFLEVITRLVNRENFEIGSVYCSNDIYNETVKDPILKKLIFKYFYYRTSICCSSSPFKITFYRKK
jgi:hypothetical protein